MISLVLESAIVVFEKDIGSPLVLSFINPEMLNENSRF